MNMMDYLDWRGDLSFKADPFNEIDNIILCQMSYVSFDGLFSYEDSITIKEAALRYFEHHTMEEVLASKEFYRLAPVVLEKLAKTKRFSNARLHHYMSYLNKEKSIQFSAVQIDLDDGSTFVAYRGTDSTLIGWKEDLQLSYKTMNSQLLALDYLNHNCDLSRSYRVGGHSKGGTLALYAAVHAKKEVKDNIVSIYNNDGPGIREMSEADYQVLGNRYLKLMPENSMVGIIYDKPCNKKIIKSDRRNLMQHDLMSWQLVGPCLETVEQLDKESVYLRDGIDKFVEEVSAEDKETFINALFENLDNANIETVTDLQSGGIGVVVRAIKAVMDLDDATKETGTKLFQLVVSSEIEAQNIIGRIRKALNVRGKEEDEKKEKN